MSKEREEGGGSAGSVWMFWGEGGVWMWICLDQDPYDSGPHLSYTPA